MDQYRVGEFRDTFIEMFRTVETSVDNPMRRAFLVFEEGDLDGNSAFWAEDEEDGAEGFLDALKDVFWTWDDFVENLKEQKREKEKEKVEKEKEKEDQDEDFSGREKYLADVSCWPRIDNLCWSRLFGQHVKESTTPRSRHSAVMKAVIVHRQQRIPKFCWSMFQQLRCETHIIPTLLPLQPNTARCSSAKFYNGSDQKLRLRQMLNGTSKQTPHHACKNINLRRLNMFDILGFKYHFLIFGNIFVFPRAVGPREGVSELFLLVSFQALGLVLYWPVSRCAKCKGKTH